MSEELLSDAALSRLAVDVLTLETPVAAERRVQHDRRKTDRRGIGRCSDRRNNGIHIGSCGAMARELHRGMRVARAVWVDKWLCFLPEADVPLPGGGTVHLEPSIVLHDAQGEHPGYRLGAAEILANDWVVLP